ncbi:cytochrome c biogenesis protein CcsA [Pyrobaculum ferrireducens]|uniref:Cytochrome c assembly protein n=1 Tax=Pyrobaculum ferrireducens TaxID=1104324 RepID=G7VGJ8_9CREN|nr:cytochrome c biogenesis protein CcsA [Pyrobaculum ferrireducens]AET33098.1 cytochrome c assembly protein [Pyrobaculum ferrireducens]
MTGWRFLLYILIAADVLSAIYLVGWGPFPLIISELGAPTAYLNVYVHVPAAILLYIVAVVALAFAVWGAVKRPSERIVKWMDFSAYTVALLGWYAFISGTIWAAESWGSPLALDPRQMSILVLALVFSIYPAIRRGVEDPDRSVKLGQAFIAAGFVLAVVSLLAPVLAQAYHPKPGTTLAGSMGMYMGLRILLLIALFFSVMFLGSARHVAWIYVVGVLISLALLYPWLFYSPVRVVNVTATSIILENGRSVPVPPGEVLSPVEVGGVPTLPKNYVAVIGGRVELVRHFSAFVNSALYFIFMALLLKLRERL